MAQKNTRTVALTAMTALLVLLVIGFGEAFAEILDAGEWQMTIQGLSELTEMYTIFVTYEGQLENAIDQSETIDKEYIIAKNAYFGAFQEVIRLQ